MKVKEPVVIARNIDPAKRRAAGEWLAENVRPEELWPQQFVELAGVLCRARRDTTRRGESPRGR